MDITLDDITGIFPRQLDADETTRAKNLITAAEELLEEEFLRAGRDYREELLTDRLLQLSAKRVIRGMVSEAIHIGDNVGRASASSTTGPQSDSVTWSQGVGIHWGSVYMTEEWRLALGLLGGSSYISSPSPKRYEVPIAHRDSSSTQVAEGARR